MLTSKEMGALAAAHTIATRIQVLPAPIRFKKGEPISVRDTNGNVRNARYLKRDGKDRSFIEINGGVISCYTYQITRAEKA